MRKLKKILAAAMSIAVVATSLSILSTGASAASTQYNTYRLYFDVASASGLKNYISLVGFDSSKLTANGGKIGTLGGSFSTGSTSYQSFGDISFPNAVVAPGTLFTLSFYGTHTGPMLDGTTAYISLNNALDPSGSFISPSPVIITEVLVGDAYHDGVVDIRDMTAIKNHIMNIDNLTGDALLAADVNNDNTVDEDDLYLLAEFIAKMINHF